MFLIKIHLKNFKNHRSFDMEFSPQINCLVGENGVGKTNILDAIHYLCNCKSYFHTSDSSAISHGESFMLIKGDFFKDEVTETVSCALKRNQKKIFKRNNYEYEKLSEHVGLFPLVFITPADIFLIHEGSEERRRFMDGLISQNNKRYLENLILYNRLLEQRNRQLKLFSEKNFFNQALLDAYSVQMEAPAMVIFETRKEFIRRFLPGFREFYQFLTGDREEVSITYQTQLENNSWKKLMEDFQQKDCVMERTHGGIHKDELVFEMNGYPLKKFSSQGQIKSFLIALKLAKYEMLKNEMGIKPLLLLDDIFEKIDNSRAEKLIQMVRGNKFGQIFITDTQHEKLKGILGGLDAEVKFISFEN